MSCIIGECFVVLPNYCAANTLIFGRSSLNESGLDEPQEVHYYDTTKAIEGKCDSGTEPKIGNDIFRLIVQKPRPGVWGCDFGANDRNVCMGITWTYQDSVKGGDSLCATDIVRYVLATSATAELAVERTGILVETQGSDTAKLNFIVCDPTEAWIISCAGKIWAAHRLIEGYQRLSTKGLSVTTIIDKSIAGLSDALKSLGHWNGEGDFNFAAINDAFECDAIRWSGNKPAGDGSYIITSMFDTLRSTSNAYSSRSANVTLLSANGISCHWFTATPNVRESVFKPFIFAPNPKISPLTTVSSADEVNTLLHKLHAQRKPVAVDNLQALEAACVEDVETYLAEHPIADTELDELMKDCVEAEVKFYR